MSETLILRNVNKNVTIEDITSHITDEYIQSLVPEVDPYYTPWGNYDLIKRIIGSEKKFNTYLMGMSGNGKTKSITQACAELGKPMINMAITSETDESQLIGHYKLIAGDFVWQNGAVLEAYLTGSVLILDEVDKADESIMCLQSILNGDPNFFIKTLKLLVREEDRRPGFQVFATANTKGTGDERGIYTTSNLLDGAFRDRFPITLEQDYPEKDTEKLILENCDANTTEEERELLTEIAVRNRILFEKQNVDDVLTTRKLVNIVQTKDYLFPNSDDPLLEAFKVAINQFEDSTYESLVALYNTLRHPEEAVEEEEEPIIREEDIPPFNFTS